MNNQTLQNSSNKDFVMTSFRLHRNLKNCFDIITEYNRTSQTSVLNNFMQDYVFEEARKIKKLEQMPAAIKRATEPEPEPQVQSNNYYPPNVPDVFQDVYDPFADRPMMQP